MSCVFLKPFTQEKTLEQIFLLILLESRAERGKELQNYMAIYPLWYPIPSQWSV